MTGLRERQKSKRRKNMLDAALKLFRERGYDQVKLEEVAEQADVSVGTVYTYFKTKNALLLAVIVKDFDEAYAAAHEVLTGPLQSCEDAFDAMCRCYFYEAEGDASRQIWCVAVSAFLRDPTSEFGRQYEHCLSMMRQQYEAMITRLQDENMLPETVDSTELATLLYNNANYIYIEYLRDDSVPMAALMQRLAQYNRRLLTMAGND